MPTFQTRTSAQRLLQTAVDRATVLGLVAPIKVLEDAKLFIDRADPEKPLLKDPVSLIGYSPKRGIDNLELDPIDPLSNRKDIEGNLKGAEEKLSTDRKAEDLKQQNGKEVREAIVVAVMRIALMILREMSIVEEKCGSTFGKLSLFTTYKTSIDETVQSSLLRQLDQYLTIENHEDFVFAASVLAQLQAMYDRAAENRQEGKLSNIKQTIDNLVRKITKYKEDLSARSESKLSEVASDPDSDSDDEIKKSAVAKPAATKPEVLPSTPAQSSSSPLVTEQLHASDQKDLKREKIETRDRETKSSLKKVKGPYISSRPYQWVNSSCQQVFKSIRALEYKLMLLRDERKNRKESRDDVAHADVRIQIKVTKAKLKALEQKLVRKKTNVDSQVQSKPYINLKLYVASKSKCNEIFFSHFAGLERQLIQGREEYHRLAISDQASKTELLVKAQVNIHQIKLALLTREQQLIAAQRRTVTQALAKLERKNLVFSAVEKSNLDCHKDLLNGFYTDRLLGKKSVTLSETQSLLRDYRVRMIEEVKHQPSEDNWRIELNHLDELQKYVDTIKLQQENWSDWLKGKFSTFLGNPSEEEEFLRKMKEFVRDRCRRIEMYQRTHQQMSRAIDFLDKRKQLVAAKQIKIEKDSKQLALLLPPRDAVMQTLRQQSSLVETKPALPEPVVRNPYSAKDMLLPAPPRPRPAAAPAPAPAAGVISSLLSSVSSFWLSSSGDATTYAQPQPTAAVPTLSQ